MNSVISFKNVSCKIGKLSVLENISLDVHQGEVVGILGPNGAGKTTTLSLVTGLCRQTQGQITVLGEVLPTRSSSLQQRIGVVLQETALYPELTTSENLQFSASLYNLADARKRIADVLELLMLTDRKDQRVGTLSGGLQRRVAIARALLHKPELLIVDEPTLGVDVEARHAIWSHLRLLRSQGTAILISTNYLDEAQALCTNVIVLAQGKLVASEAPESLVARTGTCLDVQCGLQAADALAQALHRIEGILRIERTASGLTLFLNTDSISSDAIDLMLNDKDIEGFRKRAPDLSEIFKALGTQA